METRPPWGLHRELINGCVYLQFFMDPPSTTAHSGDTAAGTNAAPATQQKTVTSFFGAPTVAPGKTPAPVPAVTGIAAVTPVTGS